MQEAGEEQNMRMEHRLSHLALIGTLSPMIGLLGTVDGMISSFKLIANTATGAPDPQALAQGISTALFTTFIGLILAIPALAAYNLLRNRASRQVLEVGIVSEGFDESLPEENKRNQERDTLPQIYHRGHRVPQRYFRYRPLFPLCSSVSSVVIENTFVLRAFIYAYQIQTKHRHCRRRP